jgi:hypothetical protein
MSRSPRRRRPSPGRPGQAQPVHPAPGGTRKVNQALEDKARSLAGLKGYVTNLATCPDGTPVTAEFVTGVYRLFEIEKSFRMSKHDLQAHPPLPARLDRGPPDHRVRRVGCQPLDRRSDQLVDQEFVRTARRYRTVEIQAGAHTITAANPLPSDLRDALDRIHGHSGAH